VEPHSDKRGGLGDKFEGFTHAPGDQVWDRIVARQSTRLLGSRFSTFAWVPRPRVWRRISAELHPQHRMRVIVGWSVAASVALAAGLGILWNVRDGETPAAMAAVERSHKSGTHPLDPGTQPDGGNAQNFASTQPHPGSSARHSFTDSNSHSSFAYRATTTHQHSPINPFDSKGKAGNPTPPLPVPDPIPSQKALALGEDPHEIERRVLFWQNLEVEKAKEAQQQLIDMYSSPIAQKADPVWVAQAGSNLTSGNANLGFRELQDGSNSNPLGVLGFDAASESVRDEDNGENFKTPLVLGAMVDHPIWKGFGVSAGVVYTRMESYRNGYGTGLMQRLEISRQYLGLAANGNYTFPLLRRWDRIAGYVNGGLQMDWGLNRHATLTTTELQRGTVLDMEVSDGHSGNQMLANVGLGLRYALFKRVGIYAQGSVAHSLFATQYNLWTTKLVWPTLQMGLRVKL
jgi:hypothetical protein